MTVTAGRSVALSTAQTGSADSTNTHQRNQARRGEPGAVVITTTIGATPTVTVNIQGSVDGTYWYNIPYALNATPETLTIAAIVITTATTTVYQLRPNHAWLYLKLVYSSNTNVTITATSYA